MGGGGRRGVRWIESKQGKNVFGLRKKFGSQSYIHLKQIHFGICDGALNKFTNLRQSNVLLNKWKNI
jgi:hypothetical protein